MKVGDLIKMLPADYGPNVKDQWAGLVGILTYQFKPPDENTWAALVKHPDDDMAHEIVVKEHLMEVVRDGL
jgi:hypothetical protein